MTVIKSLDEYQIIAAVVRDVYQRHGLINTRSLNLTLKKIRSRMNAEGLSFLTKTLPKLGKAIDKALTETQPLDIVGLRLHRQKPGSKLPRFLGELLERVFDAKSGHVLPEPCIDSIKMLRDVCYLFYKYKLPYTDEQEQAVVSKFKQTESDICATDEKLRQHAAEVHQRIATDGHSRRRKTLDQVEITRRARWQLCNLFAHFDPTDIRPRHGPGVVATRQQPHEKYHWENVSVNITNVYPLDAYFYASAGHVCDRFHAFIAVEEEDLPARVLLVPKDSRGPRLISCEPVDYQWIQQGLGRAIVQHVERHPLTENVRFTDQTPNRNAALLGSRDGRYSTLDLNEASDRVSSELVRLLFPLSLQDSLFACRSSSTVLPNGEKLKLNKFAPMGSALCFPVLALTVWSILTAAAPDAYTRERIYVYGDDVIVPTAYAGKAIEQLEFYGLKVNQDKSCTSGLFRESCGMDAYKGTCVTPVRFRTVWSESPSPDAYVSWIAYANSLYDRQYYHSYWLIAEALVRIYKRIPGDEMNHHGSYPSLRAVPPENGKIKVRWNKDYQKSEFLVYCVSTPKETHVIDGWEMLLRYFANTGPKPPDDSLGFTKWNVVDCEVDTEPLRVSQYTNRGRSMLRLRWR